MSDRRRSVSSSTLIGAGVAGVAGLATALTFAPNAGAAPASSDAPKAPAAKVAPAVADPTTTDEAPRDDVAPDYGYQKYRVGVQIKDGAYVPGGTSTAGTTLTITETAQDGTSKTFPCTTFVDDTDPVGNVPGPGQPGNTGDSTTTFCPGNRFEMRRAAARTQPTPGGIFFNYYEAAPGTTVTITQKTVNKNLVIDSSTVTIKPCLAAEESSNCKERDGEGTRETSTDAIFVDNGLPPVAANDSGRTKVGTPVTIDLADNDTPKAPVTSVDVVTKPKHGKVGLGVTDDGRNNDPATLANWSAFYTPKAGFVGKDTFTYSITTANGTATAEVTVTVTAPPPVAKDDTAKTAVDTPVRIHVLDNDTTKAGTLSVFGATGPDHGSVRQDGNTLVYTPDDGFTGTDTFVYTAQTAYGRDTATVTVTVSGSGIDDNSKNRDDLADTGAQSAELVGYGAALLLGGGAAIALGTRRRRRARHAAR